MRGRRPRVPASKYNPLDLILRAVYFQLTLLSFSSLVCCDCEVDTNWVDPCPFIQSSRALFFQLWHPSIPSPLYIIEHNYQYHGHYSKSHAESPEKILGGGGVATQKNGRYRNFKCGTVFFGFCLAFFRFFHFGQF